MLTDSQITDETMLEDINGMLNTGEVPNLFTAEEKVLAAPRHLGSRVFTSGGVGGVNRAPQNWGEGGSGKGLN